MIIQKERSIYVIKKSTIEWFLLLLLILFSFINSTTLLISMFLLLALLQQKEIGAIKILNIITLRTIINTGISPNIGDWQSLKWIILFGCSFYLLLAYFKLEKQEIRKINPILSIITVFIAYNFFVALVYSSLPMIAILKLLSYVVIFLGILIGVGYTYKKINWLKWMFISLSLVIIPSIVLIPISVGYFKNGSSFQGFTNQPNMFGIISVLYIASLFAYARSKEKVNGLNLIMLPALTFYMVVLSKSRTALISCVLLLLLFIVLSKIKKFSSLAIMIFSTAGVILLMLGSSFNKFIYDFLYKGQEQGNLLYSRMNQVSELTSNFMKNPLFGNGFAVPVLPFKSFEFSYDFIVEPGNLILAVLSYSGVIGFIIFSVYILAIFRSNHKNFRNLVYLPLATILISMGEMVFFSSNNIGIWCYMFLAMYVFYGANKYQKS